MPPSSCLSASYTSLVLMNLPSPSSPGPFIRALDVTYEGKDWLRQSPWRIWMEVQVGVASLQEGLEERGTHINGRSRSTILIIGVVMRLEYMGKMYGDLTQGIITTLLYCSPPSMMRTYNPPFQVQYHLGDLALAQSACERLAHALESPYPPEEAEGGGFACSAVSAVVGVPSREGVELAVKFIGRLLSLKVPPDGIQHSLFVRPSVPFRLVPS